MGVCGSTEAVNPDFIDLTHFEIMKVVGKGGFGKVNAITKKDTQELMALKRMEKFAVLQSNAHLNMVWVERKIMSLQSSPFLCNLIYAFQSPVELYLVMPFMQGGDMRYHLREHGPLSEAHTKFYAAELLCGIADLHAKRVVFRDMKPENILVSPRDPNKARGLDDAGHLRLSDFGLGHQLVPEKNYQITGQAGTRGYQSPEVLRNQYYGCEVDVFSYGITVYELLHGQRPWKEAHRSDHDDGGGGGGGGGGGSSGDAIMARFKEFPVSSKLSAHCTSFLRGVLAAEWQARLGCAPKNVAPDGSFAAADQRVNWDEMRAHPWFADIDWATLYAKKIAPPFLPDNSRANCSPEADLADQLLDHKPRAITEEQQKNFTGWDFNTSLATVRQQAAAGAAGASAAAAPAGSGKESVEPGQDQTRPTQPSPAPAASSSSAAGAAAAPASPHHGSNGHVVANGATTHVKQNQGQGQGRGHGLNGSSSHEDIRLDERKQQQQQQQ